MVKQFFLLPPYVFSGISRSCLIMLNHNEISPKKLSIEKKLLIKESHCIRSFLVRISPHSDWIRGEVSFRIQSKYGKIRTRKTLSKDTFQALSNSISDQFFKHWVIPFQTNVSILKHLKISVILDVTEREH